MVEIFGLSLPWNTPFSLQPTIVCHTKFKYHTRNKVWFDFDISGVRNQSFSIRNLFVHHYRIVQFVWVFVGITLVQKYVRKYVRTY